ncbi:ligand-gated channel [Micractinium conductrix]|uniref:Ligand-gated channel n=1 Tax=Micractinium conductrix TaxID=554055 RepID=A0A2P6VKD4_9CHLO|nr:ligand-gated channel [Micractinium conductrix]|eukprot:PSC74562.1 ligand-gated channel [Micractinium conductrix]
MLARAFATPLVARLPLMAAGVHSTAASQAPSASAAAAAAGPIQQALGLSGQEVASLLEAQPDLAATRPSVLHERMEFLGCLGLSPSRLRSLILQKPSLLGDLSMRELRSIAGLSS